MRKKLWFVVPGIVIVAAFLVFEHQTRVLRGTLRGEPFYRGRPSSYWARVLGRYQAIRTASVPVVHVLPDGALHETLETSTVYLPCRSTWEIWIANQLPLAGKYLMQQPLILNGESDALAVLQVLLEDENAMVRLMAARGLGALLDQARPAVPALSQRLEDPDAEVRKQVDIALLDIESAIGAAEVN
jgi:hypothetical protein